jgi:hypothetical protein
MFTAEDPDLFELSPSTAFTIGNVVYMPTPTNAGAGRVTNCSGTTPSLGILGIIGVSVSTTVATDTVGANGATSLVTAPVYTNRYNVWRVSVTGQIDGTATAGSTTTLVDSTGLASTTANAYGGGVLWIYAGTNMGQMRTITSFSAHTATWINPMAAACDTTTKYIVFGGGSAAGYSGINKGSYVQMGSGSCALIDVSANPTAPGQFIVEEVEPWNLAVLVRISAPLFL